jgi:diguanylate cyclase (GGDEF)-like protein
MDSSEGTQGVDQVTAAALAVALVVNVVILVLALVWARRNRPDTVGRATGQRPPTKPDGPWWDGRGERGGILGQGMPRSDGAQPDAEADRRGDEPAGHPRAAIIFESLESAAAWRGMLTLEAARVTRYGRPATIVIADLEGLDRLAARLGPESVERLLPAVAATLRREARSADRIARLASARFGILLPETGEVDAINWVERVRDSTDLWLEASAVSLRIAFGWAELGPDSDVEAVLEQARERLDAERRSTRSNGRADAPSRTDRPSGNHRSSARDTPPAPARETAPPTVPGTSGSPLAAG